MGLLNLKEIEAAPGAGKYASMIAAARAAGRPTPGIWHLFAFKPHVTDGLAAFTEGVMRGPSPLSAGFRELIAAFTSARNQCPF